MIIIYIILWYFIILLQIIKSNVKFQRYDKQM
jgi:hypothetical protein